jgi:hypothetical protein
VNVIAPDVVAIDTVVEYLRRLTIDAGKTGIHGSKTRVLTLA